ncbi:MAG: dethiobiotin synthase [Sulfuricellaceae bacterium]|nr:dethiobiotin synthase [Sulfuricellaceae bacterium]
MSSLAFKGLFVAGTDTDCGKTLISCALLHAYAATGLQVAGMKPVATGCETGSGGEWSCEDVRLLRQASSRVFPLEWVNPYAFTPPVSPHIAAAESNQAISLEKIADCYASLSAQLDLVVVEGTGGFRTPLSEEVDMDMADLAVRLGLPVVLVVGMRLGCLNHALLTAEAIRSRGLALAGWVANQIDPGMDRFQTNIDTLKHRLEAPLLGVVAFNEKPDAAEIGRNLSLLALSL